MILFFGAATSWSAPAEEVAEAFDVTGSKILKSIGREDVIPISCRAAQLGDGECPHGLLTRGMVLAFKAKDSVAATYCRDEWATWWHLEFPEKSGEQCVLTPWHGEERPMPPWLRAAVISPRTKFIQDCQWVPVGRQYGACPPGMYASFTSVWGVYHWQGVWNAGEQAWVDLTNRDLGLQTIEKPTVLWREVLEQALTKDLCDDKDIREIFRETWSYSVRDVLGLSAECFRI
jgi:hypothetical protein